jgi:hypothetical protein
MAAGGRHRACSSVHSVAYADCDPNSKPHSIADADSDPSTEARHGDAFAFTATNQHAIAAGGTRQTTRLW